MATDPARKKAAQPPTTPKKPAPQKRVKAGTDAPATAKPRPQASQDSRRPSGSGKGDATHQPTLPPKQQRFVDEYLVDLNGTQAAIRAGYSAATASEQAYDLLRKPQIQAAIAAARADQQKRTQISADRVVLEAWNILTADPRDLVQVKVGCCRHCYGEGHKRQRTLAEYNTARARHKEAGKPDEEWDEEGGIGYTPLLPPHSACPECHGDGCPRVVLGDTRNLSPVTLALYAGAKHGKHGIEVLMHDKAAFAEKLFRHLGLYEKDHQQQIDPLAALLHAIAAGASSGFAPRTMDPERPQAAEQQSAFTPRQDVERD